MITTSRKQSRKKRHRRIRKKILGTEDRPRMCVYKSLKHLYVQLIDDTKGETLAAASTLDQELNGNGSNMESAKKVGELVANRAKQRGIKEVVFDRSGYPYHGVVKQIAETARENGLEF